MSNERPNWVEGLPAALRILNDLPGPTGYSAYQLAYGRDRPLAGVPSQPPRIAHDAQVFLQRMEDMREAAARQLEVMHQRDADLMAQWRRRKVEFKAADRVWYHRPAPVGGLKLRTNLIGPCVVLRRESQSSYLIEVKPDVPFVAHTDGLKENVEPERGAAGLPLNYYRLTETPEEALPDEFIVDRLVDHGILPDGTVDYKTLWRGYPETEFSCEPSSQFVHRFSADWADYVQRHGLVENVARQLDPRTDQRQHMVRLPERRPHVELAGLEVGAAKAQRSCVHRAAAGVPSAAAEEEARCRQQRRQRPRGPPPPAQNPAKTGAGQATSNARGKVPHSRPGPREPGAAHGTAGGRGRENG